MHVCIRFTFRKFERVSHQFYRLDCLTQRIVLYSLYRVYSVLFLQQYNQLSNYKFPINGTPLIGILSTSVNFYCQYLYCNNCYRCRICLSCFADRSQKLFKSVQQLKLQRVYIHTQTFLGSWDLKTLRSGVISNSPLLRWYGEVKIYIVFDL